MMIFRAEEYVVSWRSFNGILLAFGLFILLIEGPGVWAVPSLPFVVKVTLVARLIL